MEQAKITAEQTRAVLQSNGQPVYLVDDSGQDASVAIVRIELLKTLVGEEFDIADTYKDQEEVLAGVWGDDPQLDEYTDQDGSPVE